MSKPVKLLSLAVACACVLLAINFGMRASFGFFMTPISSEFGYGREIFAFSLALQNLCWGLFQPIAGAVADRFGTAKTIYIGSIAYALGLYVTATADSFWGLHIGAGILVGMGIAGTGLGVVLPALARMVSLKQRGLALGIGTAAGSFGQLLVIPVAQEFISAYGWQITLMILAGGSLCMLLLSGPFRNDGHQSAVTASEPSQTETQNQTLSEAVKEASGHLHYWLLIAGFFVCGFQLAFITVHMPAYLSDNGFDARVAVISLSLIGLFNIFGCLLFGSWSGKYSKKKPTGYYLSIEGHSDCRLYAHFHDHHDYLFIFYYHGLSLVGYSATHFGLSGTDVWFKAHGYFVRYRLFKPSIRVVLRGLVGRLLV